MIHHHLKYLFNNQNNHFTSFEEPRKINIFFDSLRILIPLFLTYGMLVAIIFLILIPEQKNELLKQKKESLVQLTESVMSLLDDYDARVQRNELSIEKAQIEAADLIQKIRYGYGKRHYFWITDLESIIIMHPFRKDLEGKGLPYIHDGEKKIPFVSFVKILKKDKQAYINYLWRHKKDQPEPEFKLSFIKIYQPWG